MVTRHRRRAAVGRRHGGFTYLGVLIAVAVLGIALLAETQAWIASGQRARLAQADWAGAQYVQAIASYVEHSPAGARAFPRRLHELVEDRRGPTLRRHLRQLYANPFSGDGAWMLLRGGDGGIVGVGLALPDGQGPRTYAHAPPRAP